MDAVTAFLDDQIVARGSRERVKHLLEDRYPADLGEIRVFEDGSGRLVDLDYWDAAASAPAPPRRRGRPSLGVAAREVTLLPRHWEWLARQPGGASAAIRRLVEQARRQDSSPGEKRDSVYHFLSHMGGNRPGYEEALRALYRGDEERFRAHISPWPAGIRDYAESLLAGPS